MYPDRRKKRLTGGPAKRIRDLDAERRAILSAKDINPGVEDEHLTDAQRDRLQDIYAEIAMIRDRPGYTDGEKGT